MNNATIQTVTPHMLAAGYGFTDRKDAQRALAWCRKHNPVRGYGSRQWYRIAVYDHNSLGRRWGVYCYTQWRDMPVEPVARLGSQMRLCVPSSRRGRGFVWFTLGDRKDFMPTK